MSRLTSPAQTHIAVNGRRYPLNTNYRNALLTWDALEAAATGEISPLAAAHAAIANMLGLDIADMEYADINAALQSIADYLHKYARISGNDQSDARPLLDLEHDAQMIYDGIGIGIAIALLTNLNLFGILDINIVSSTAGCILTGIIVSRGSNYLSDLIGKLNKAEG